MPNCPTYFTSDKKKMYEIQSEKRPTRRGTEQMQMFRVSLIFIIHRAEKFQSSVHAALIFPFQFHHRHN